MQLVRVVAPNFVAGFETDAGRVQRTAPILRRHLLGRTDEEAREIIWRMGWKAHVVVPKTVGNG